jgi:hypothetical protein
MAEIELAKSQLTADLIKVQGSLPNIKKDAKGNYGKYVTLDAIHESVLPLLSKHNLAWVTMPVDLDGDAYLDYKLMHTSGERLEGSMKLNVSQPTMQQLGSAITYAKRYAICAVLGVTADDDDDAESATKAPYKATQKTWPKKQEDELIQAVEIANETQAAITPDQVGKLLNAAKMKGYTTKEKASEAVQALSVSIFDTKYESLNFDEAEKLINDISSPKTTKDLLDTLVSGEPF